MTTWKDEETAEENRHSLRLIYVGQKLHGKIIDIGCNSGFLLDHLTDKATRYWGIDGSEKLINEARKKYGSAPQFHCTDFSNGLKNVKDEWFDCAFMGEVLEHLEQPEPVIASIYRVLKPGGIFIITTPLKLENVNKILKGVTKVVGGNKDHSNEYTTEQLVKLCRRAGFKETGYQLVSQNNRKWFRLIQVLECQKPT